MNALWSAGRLFSWLRGFSRALLLLSKPASLTCRLFTPRWVPIRSLVISITSLLGRGRVWGQLIFLGQAEERRGLLHNMKYEEALWAGNVKSFLSTHCHREFMVCQLPDLVNLCHIWASTGSRFKATQVGGKCGDRGQQKPGLPTLSHPEWNGPHWCNCWVSSWTPTTPQPCRHHPRWRCLATCACESLGWEMFWKLQSHHVTVTICRARGVTRHHLTHPLGFWQEQYT